MTAPRPSGAPGDAHGPGVGSVGGSGGSGAAEGDTAPRRLRIAIDNDHAEAVEFSNGVIVAFWHEAQQLYAWRDLATLREQLPGAKLIWIDGSHTHA